MTTAEGEAQRAAGWVTAAHPVAGRSMVLETYGTVSLDSVLAPVIDLAKRGFKPTSAYHEAVDSPHLRLYPDTKQLFQARSDDALVALPDYAKTLESIAERGP